MVGVFNMGLGPGRTSSGSGDLTSLGAAYWLGAVVKYYRLQREPKSSRPQETNTVTGIHFSAALPFHKCAIQIKWSWLWRRNKIFWLNFELGLLSLFVYINCVSILYFLVLLDFSSVHCDWNNDHPGWRLPFVMPGECSDVWLADVRMLCCSWTRVCFSQLGFAVFMNIAGALFAITAIVLYVVDLENAPLVWVCDGSRNSVFLTDDSCGHMALFVQVKTTILSSVWSNGLDHYD